MYNRLILCGYLIKDVELRYTSNGIPVAQFIVATNRKFAYGASEKYFGECVCFGRQAETIKKYLRKGAKVLLEGRLVTEKHGESRYRTKVVIENISFLDKRKENEETLQETLQETILGGMYGTSSMS